MRVATLLVPTLLLGLAIPSAAQNAIREDDPAAFRAHLERSCPLMGQVDRVIQEAIQIGAPIYNAGSALGCYRIYEGASYKLLYRLGDSCEAVAVTLGAGLRAGDAAEGATAKAWALRRTFDMLLGTPTRTR